MYVTKQIVIVCIHLLTMLYPLDAFRSYANPLFALTELIFRKIASVPIMKTHAST